MTCCSTGSSWLFASTNARQHWYPADRFIQDVCIPPVHTLSGAKPHARKMSALCWCTSAGKQRNIGLPRLWNRSQTCRDGVVLDGASSGHENPFHRSLLQTFTLRRTSNSSFGSRDSVTRWSFSGSGRTIARKPSVRGIRYRTTRTDPTSSVLGVSSQHRQNRTK